MNSEGGDVMCLFSLFTFTLFLTYFSSNEAGKT